MSLYLGTHVSNNLWNTKTDGVFTRYTYKTYFLQGDRAFNHNLSTLYTSLSNSKIRNNISKFNDNQFLLSIMAANSTPWLITYELDEDPTDPSNPSKPAWNPGKSWLDLVGEDITGRLKI